VKSKLENELGYATLEMNDNVVGLSRQLKQMAFASGGVQHPFWTLQIVLQCLLAINLAANDYQLAKSKWWSQVKQLGATSQVLENKIGQRFFPTK
jgi:hypothetical protein